MRHDLRHGMRHGMRHDMRGGWPRGPHHDGRHGWRRHGIRFLLFAAVAIAALGGVVMGLWNTVVLDLVPGVRPLDYLHALGLLLLCRILFGGFRGGGGGGWHGRHRWHAWHAMTPEERERFRHGLRPPAPETEGSVPPAPGAAP